MSFQVFQRDEGFLTLLTDMGFIPRVNGQVIFPATRVIDHIENIDGVYYLSESPNVLSND